jgi:hypothetical protein
MFSEMQCTIPNSGYWSLSATASPRYTSGVRITPERGVNRHVDLQEHTVCMVERFERARTRTIARRPDVSLYGSMESAACRGHGPVLRVPSASRTWRVCLEPGIL